MTITRNMLLRGIGCCVALALFAVSGMGSVAFAQPAPVNGPRHVDARWHALVGGTVVVRPGETIENATVVFRDGVVVSVRADALPPRGARVWDCSGLMVYPGLVDAHVAVEVEGVDGDSDGAHWNDKVMAQRGVLDGGGGLPGDVRGELLEMGFAVAAVAPEDGVFRGRVSVVLTGDEGGGGGVILPTAFHEVSFETNSRGGEGRPAYPGSQMGAIALIRQTFLDADWHFDSLGRTSAMPGVFEPVSRSDALVALGRNDEGSFPLLFDTEDELEAIRAGKIAREFGRRYALVGSGTEFRRLDAIVEDGASVIVPVNYPEVPAVGTEAEAAGVSLRTLMTWEQSPTNAKRLDDAGVLVALTTDKLKKKGDFFGNVRRSIAFGLGEDRALAMLTTNAAEILGVGDSVGEIRAGMLASFVVTDGGLFEEEMEIRDVWVAGQRHEVNAGEGVLVAGTWDYTFGDDGAHDGAFVVTQENGKITIQSEAEDEEKKFKARGVELQENRLTYLVDSPDGDGAAMISAVVEGNRMLGRMVTADGGRMNWSGTRRVDEAGGGDDEEEGEEDEGGKDAKLAAGVPGDLVTPLGAYGVLEIPESGYVWIKNATIWTCGPEGIIENGNLIVVDGKIQAVGRLMDVRPPSGGKVIDAEGKHVTPGIIDCHSHTGISKGVNEGTQAVTSEVRIADVINPDAIGWYRELAGGVTVVNQLHGSANPIGGQNSVVKNRWGAGRPDDLRFDGAIEGIKFALGENVKQSNWGEKFTTRYPQTRMGVESIIRDRFVAASEYVAERERFDGLSSSEREHTMPVRQDLELDALGEIIAGDRLVHSHSYRQDEILMLCRVAQEFGFRIGTFQHVLEGYKVAEAIKEAAIGGSTFSDWWAYKFEVYDAIPENGAIMHDVGVVVSFNSDSDELARRLNQEAAKAVRYGGVSPEEALKFVTLNPAKQLMIDDRVGSLEEGKDADFVIWSGDPLSAFTRCEATYVDGREMFSLERDLVLREEAMGERGRIIQKILSLDSPKKKDALAGGDDDGDAEPTAAEVKMELRAIEMLRSGLDPDASRCGECGEVLGVH